MIINALTRWRQRRAFEKRVAHLPPYEQSMRVLRFLAATGGSHRAMLRAATRAYETAPTEEDRRHALRWLRPLEHGRRIRVKVVPFEPLTIEGYDADLVGEIESAFEGHDD